MDAEAEFLVSIKAVRQQKCRMSPLSTTRNPYHRHKRILAKTAAFWPRSSNYICPWGYLLFIHLFVIFHIVTRRDIVEPILVLKIPFDRLLDSFLEL